METNRDKHESVLVIVLAETRAHEFTFDLIKENLLDVMNADLALCVANNEREDPSNPFYRHAKYVWTYDEPDDWGDAFDDISENPGSENDWRKLLEVKDQWLGGIKGKEEHPGSAGILIFFRLFLKKSIMESNALEEYDRFVITRSDFIHKVPHVPLSLLSPRYIWVPKGEDYGGYTDRHIVVHQKDLLKVLSIGERILTEPEKLYSEMIHYKRWNLEQFIRFCFNSLGIQHKIRRFPYTMYSIRPPGGHTRWVKGKYSEELGYYIKYPTEYRRYKLASKLIKEPGDWNIFTITLFRLLRFILELKFKIEFYFVKGY